MDCLIGIGTSIAGTIAEYTVNAVGRQIGYFITYKKNIEELGTQVVELKRAKERVDHDVSEATNNCGIIEEDVQHWLKEAELISGEAAKLLQRDEDQVNKCFSRGSFSGVIKRYKISKEAKKTVDVIATTVVKKFPKVYYLLPPSYSLNIDGYEEFKTRDRVFGEIIEALRHVRVRMIGVWGMGGVGKTMLVNAIASKAKSENLFTRVVLTTVSQTLDERKVQADVAETLGLELNENNVALRANRLRERLSSEKKILIIIDDIWSKLDLKDIGIVFADDQIECKILLTSRSQDVLCNEMCADKSFNLGVLSKFEAIDLFDGIAGDRANKLEFQDVKKNILQRCGGLPLAVSIVAKALKEKSLSIWEDAWQELRMSNPVNIKGVEKEVYAVIQWSYDFLQSEEAKSLLVLFSLHKEDEDISVEVLLRRAMGLRVFHSTRKIKDARNRIFHLVETLKSSSLLLDSTKDNYVRMHDIVRDVILSIASKDKDRKLYFIRNTEELNERLNDNELEDSMAICLHYNNGTSSLLPERLPCPKLRLLSLSPDVVAYFQQDSRAQRIPNQFLESTKDLLVLDLMSVDVNLASLSSFCFLNNLKTLICSRSRIGDIACIGELKCLEILDLSRSDIMVVPKELRTLTRLLSLNLSSCFFLKVIEAGVLSSSIQLEELYVTDTKARLTELKEQTRVTTLRVDIFDAEDVLPKDLAFDKLEKFQLYITSSNGNRLYAADRHRFSRSLILEKIDDGLLERSCLIQLIKEAENLYMSSVNVTNSFSGEFGMLPHLKFLTLFLVTVRYVIDASGSSNLSAFQNLEEIDIAYSRKLKTICNGCNLSGETLAKLRAVKVRECHSLKNLFPALSLRRLEKLEMSDCQALEYVFINNIKNSEVIEFPLLHTLELVLLPELKQFTVGSPTTQTRDVDRFSLFHHQVAFPSLTKLRLENLDSLEMIWPDDDHELTSDNSFSNLENLDIINCNKLTRVCTSSMLRKLKSLTRLSVENCDAMEELFDFRKPIACEEKLEKINCPISSLKLSYLPKLEHILSYNKEQRQQLKVTFNKLEKLSVSHCWSLINLFSASVARELHQLDFLSVYYCGKMREIIAYEDGAEEIVPKFVFPQLRYLKMEDVFELECLYRGTHCCEFPVLGELTLHRCGEVKILASQLSDQLETTGEATDSANAPLFFMNTVAFPRLEEMDLKGLDRLKKIWQGDQELPSDSFGELKRIGIHSCQALTPVFSHNLLAHLGSLITLNIEDCAEVEAIFKMPSAKSSFPKIITQITDLTLHDLPKLKHVWSYEDHCNLQSGTSSFITPKLKVVSVHACPSLESLFPASTAKDLLELQSINLQYCDEIQEIIAREKETPEMISKFEFPKLTWLGLNNLPELKCLYPCSHTSNWPSLSDLTIENCGKVKILASQVSDSRAPLFCLDTNVVLFPRLERMDLNSLDHLEIICQLDQELVLPGSFGELNFISVKNCGALLKVFSHNIQENTGSLTDLTLKGCGKGVITPQLRRVNVTNCPSLQCLFPASAAKDLLKLESIEIEDCGQMQEIIARENDAPKFNPEFEFPLLSRLYLNNLPALKCVYPDLHTSNWPSLTELKLVGCVNVKILTLQLSTFEMKTIRDACINTSLLTMKALSNLKGFFIPSSASFENLTFLVVMKYGTTGSLFDPSTAKSLPQLKSLLVGESNGMTEVIGDAREKGQIVFGKLETLVLACLPKLLSFHPGSYDLLFPSLEQLAVFHCPEMRRFSDVATTPKLKGVFTGTEHINVILLEMEKFPSHENKYSLKNALWRAKPVKEQWDSDINSTWQNIHYSSNKNDMDGEEDDGNEEAETSYDSKISAEIAEIVEEEIVSL